MTPVQILWLLVGGSWAMLELAIVIKNRSIPVDKNNSHSPKIIWLASIFALVMALLFKHWQYWPIPVAYLPRQIMALLVFGMGLGLRFYAVARLGKFFTTTAMVQTQHQLVEHGPYRFVRHPAYSGLLLGFLAAGWAMGDGLALLALCAPLIYALHQRINHEETLLVGHFGQVYYDYCLRTKKLIPWLY